VEIRSLKEVISPSPEDFRNSSSHENQDSKFLRGSPSDACEDENDVMRSVSPVLTQRLVVRFQEGSTFSYHAKKN